MFDFNFSKNVNDSSAIYDTNTVAIFPLSKKVVNNMEQPEDMGQASSDVT